MTNVIREWPDVLDLVFVQLCVFYWIYIKKQDDRNRVVAIFRRSGMHRHLSQDHLWLGCLSSIYQPETEFYIVKESVYKRFWFLSPGGHKSVNWTVFPSSYACDVLLDTAQRQDENKGLIRWFFVDPDHAIT